MLVLLLTVTMVSVEGAIFKADLAASTISGSDMSAQDGQKWKLLQGNTKGGITVNQEGLIFKSDVKGARRAMLLTPSDIAGPEYVVKTSFTLEKPYLMLKDYIQIIVRTGDGDDKDAPCYKIGYKVGFYSRTAWSIGNTGISKEGPASKNQSPYRIIYGRKYTAYAHIKNSDKGVEIKFYLDDPEIAGDMNKPLLAYTDSSAKQIKVNGKYSLQVGADSSFYTSSKLTYHSLDVLSAQEFTKELSSLQDDVSYPSEEQFYAHRKLNRDKAGWIPKGFYIPNVFQDNMMFQRDMPINIWGFAPANSEVTVKLNSETKKVKVGKDYKWKLQLPPMKAGGPYKLTISSGSKKKVIKNVLIDEVWVIAGQSNVDVGLHQTPQGKEEVAASNYPNLRFYKGWGGCSDNELFEVPGGSWFAPKPELKGKFSAIQYFFAKYLHKDLNVPVGIINTARGGTELYTWIPEKEADLLVPAVFKKYKGKFGGARMDPGLAYNTMVAPWKNFAVRGILWYQGEGNSKIFEGKLYEQELTTMIKAYRRQFNNAGLPFLIVQIAGYGEDKPKMPWARTSYVRQSMENVAENLQHSGLVVTTDVSDIKDIHPTNKEPVGRRLYHLAKNISYGGENIRCPIIDTVSSEGSKVICTFKYVSKGLKITDGTIKGFELKGADGKVHVAQARIIGKDTVEVSASAVTNPKEVLFGWHNYPVTTLVNSHKFPASPFMRVLP